MRFANATVIADRYTIEAYLGEGSFGAVYRAASSHYGTVAIKLLPFDPACSRQQQILQEARTLAQMEHPHVIKCYEIGQHLDGVDQYGYIAMEYLAGGTLHAMLDRQVRIPIDQALTLTAEILEALAFAHSQIPPILHGDVKPENILLSDSSPVHAYLTDFGVAQLACEVTGMAPAAGTLFYMSPESLWGYAVPASDVFGVGMLLYAMITGVSPFVLPDMTALSDKERRKAIDISRQTAPQPPSTFNPAIEAPLDDIVLRALALDHKTRFHNAGEFLQALQRIDENELSYQGSPLSPYELYAADLPPFPESDYRELALSGVLSRSELATLWEYFCDLERTVDLDGGGLFSPMTITGRTKTELTGLNGRSMSDWLFDDETACSDLRMIKEIGKQYWANQHSIRAQRTGMLLYIVAVAQAYLHYRESITSLSNEQLHGMCEDFLSRSALPPKYRMTLERYRSSIA